VICLKINWQSLIVTLICVGILLVSLTVGVGIFITGPKYADEAKEEKIIQKIEDQLKDAFDIHRHAFRYVVYVVKQENRYVFFNEKSEAIATRLIDKEGYQKANQLIQKEYGLLDCTLQVGYGVDGPAYYAENDQGLVVLDYDTLKEIYYLKKGEL
jgi:hypothetical protein